MEDIVKKFKSVSVLTILISAILGMILIAFPSETVKIISLIFGIAIIVFGIVVSSLFFAKKSGKATLVIGIIIVIFGIFVCTKYDVLISFIEILLGLSLIVSSTADFASSIVAHRSGAKSWLITLLLSVVVAATGVVIVVNPFSSAMFLVRFIGVSLIGLAILELISFIQFKKTVSKVNADLNTVYIQDNLREDNDE